MGEVSKRRGGARLAPETADKAQDKPDKPTAPEQKADAKRKLLRGWLYLIPEDISNGRGSVEDLDLLKDCCELIIKANECELSVRTAELVKASLETHYDEWYDHLTRKRCKAMECPACYTLYIDPALCNGCGKCLGAAPENAVVGGEGMIHVIKKDLLAMKTGEFAAVCPVGAIKKAIRSAIVVPSK